MIHFRVIMILLLLTGIAGAVPVEEWNRTFDLGRDSATSVQQTGDGGYVIIGYSWPTRPLNGGAWLIKTDPSGNMLWNRTFGGWDPTNEPHSVQQTSDGGYIFTGVAYPIGDVWLVKTDAIGNEVWNRTFDFGGVDLGSSVQQTSDGGYIIAGYNYERAFLIKTDADGNQQWSRIFEGYANSVEQTVDGGYILLGGTYIGGIGLDIWLIKTDSAGNEVWKTTFKGNDVSARSVMQTSDRGYIIAGSISPFSISSIIFGPNYDALLIKTDAKGNEEWKKTFGGRGRDYASSVQQTEDGGYIIAGLTGEEFKGGDTVVANAWLFKTDIDGNKVWEKTFGGDGFDQFSSVQQTGDGGYILAGSTTSYGAGTLDIPFTVSDAWLVKVSGEPEGTAVPKKTPAFEALLFFITLTAVYVRGLWRGK